MKETGKYEHLSYEERSTIALGLQQGMSVRAIARALGRSPSTISRESRRNAPAAPYNCKFAQQRYQRRRRYSRPQPKLAPESTLFEQVCRLLRRLWSPEQSWLQCMHRSESDTKPSTPASMPSTPRAHRLPAHGASQTGRAHAARTAEARFRSVSIHVRQINERSFGHWEGDLIKGAAAPWAHWWSAAVC
jgi:IS30 family transposase